MLLAAFSAYGLLGLGGTRAGSAGAAAALAVAFVLAALAWRVNAWVVRREVASWRRALPPRPRALPLLAGTAMAFVLSAVWTADVAVVAAGVATVAAVGALTPAGRAAQRTTLAVYVAWSVLGAGFSGLPLA